ncbi:hypothetical protein CSUI_001827, partial [Cystoisospora suis]
LVCLLVSLLSLRHIPSFISLFSSSSSSSHLSFFLFRTSVAILRVEVSRSAYGKREYAVPPRSILNQALTLLFSRQLDGDSIVVVSTHITQDTRFSFIRKKKAKASISLITGLRPSPRLIGNGVVLSDIRSKAGGENRSTRSILTSLVQYIASNFLPQNLIRFKSQLEGRVFYLQLLTVKEGHKKEKESEKNSSQGGFLFSSSSS